MTWVLCVTFNFLWYKITFNFLWYKIEICCNMISHGLF